MKPERTRDALYRILRALASIGFFVEDDEGRFGLTTMAEVLGSPGGTGYARLHGQELFAAWGNVLHTVKTGEPSFIKTHGMPLFDYMNEVPGAWRDLFERHVRTSRRRDGSDDRSV